MLHPENPSAMARTLHEVKTGLPAAGKAGFPGRAFALGLAFVVYYAVGGPGGGGGFHLPTGSLFVLMLLLGVWNPVARRLGRRPFDAGELGLIWGMVLVGLLSGTMAAYLPASIAGPRYFGSAENKWPALFHRYLPDWLFVADPGAILHFYEGLPAGQGTPWRLWVGPLAAWSVLGAAFFGLMTLGAAALRRRWVEHERLSFPIVQLPAELCLDAAPIAGRRPILRHPLLWIGFALAAGHQTINNLHAYYPAVPGLGRDVVLPLERLTPPWNQLHPIYLCVIPTAIGFAFLLPTEVSLSFWFFFLFARLEAVAGGALGFPMPWAAGYMARTFLSHQEFGAFLAIGIGLLWAARRHLGAVWRGAWRRDGADRDEPLTYRTVVIGFLLSALVAVAWFMAAGQPALLAIAITLTFFLICLVGSWAIAAGGVLFLQNAFGPTRVFASVVGSAALTPAGLTMLKIPEQVFMSDLRSLEMPNFFEGQRLADDLRASRRTLFVGMLAALAVGAVVSLVYHLWYSYHWGALTHGSSWGNVYAAQIPGQMISTWLQQPEEMSPCYLAWVGIGAAGAAMLLRLRAVVLWWPLHPIGFALASSFAIYVLWFAFFLGWLAKTLTLRFSGLKGFLLLRPAFLGLILGDCVSGSLWATVNYFTKTGYPLWPW